MTAPEASRRAAHLGAALVIGRIAFGLALLAVWVRRGAIPHYEPLERAVRFGSSSPHAMHWYGATLVSTAVGTVAILAALALAGRSERLSRLVTSPEALSALARLAATVMVVDFCWFGWAMWSQPLAGGPP